MKIFHAPNTRSVRVVWLCEELGLDYELEKFKLGDGSMRAPEYLKIHPMARVPSIQDGDVTIFESGAIIEYILEKHGNGRLHPGTDSPDFPSYLQWLHYAEGMIMPHVNILVVETLLLPEDKRNPVNIDRSTKQLTRMLGAVNMALESEEYLAGDFTGADIMTGHACTVGSRLGADISDKPNVEAYIKRLNNRPAMQKAWAS